MTAKLASDDGKACYGKRKETIEPVFRQIKDGRGARRFLRRGLTACEAEWKLLCGTHNLLKLWRHTVIRPAATPAIALAATQRRSERCGKSRLPVSRTPPQGSKT